MINNEVILVDEGDQVLGTMDKLKAHQEGCLHRAFSVFILNNRQEMLIHQRADEKYHGGGLWTNACCSHPSLHQNIQNQAEQRLNFEMGINCSLSHLFNFTYKAEVENNLIEHEYDYVFIGRNDDNPKPNSSEVKNWKWVQLNELEKDIKENPFRYTVWFKIAFPIFLNHFAND